MAAWKYEISLLVLSSLVSSFRISVRRQYPTVAHRFQNTSQNPKHVPESKTRPRIQKHIPESKYTSQNSKHIPESRLLPRIQQHFIFNSWERASVPRVIAGTVICKLVTRSLVVDGHRVEASRILRVRRSIVFEEAHAYRRSV